MFAQKRSFRKVQAFLAAILEQRSPGKLTFRAPRGHQAYVPIWMGLAEWVEIFDTLAQMGHIYDALGPLFALKLLLQ